MSNQTSSVSDWPSLNVARFMRLACGRMWSRNIIREKQNLLSISCAVHASNIRVLYIEGEHSKLSKGFKASD